MEKARNKMIRAISFLITAVLLLNTDAAVDDDSTDSYSRCELLNTSLTYSQENAPRDISGVVSSF